MVTPSFACIYRTKDGCQENSSRKQHVFHRYPHKTPKMLNITRINNLVPITTEESARSKTDGISAHRRHENGSHSRGHEIVPVSDRTAVDAYDCVSTKGRGDNEGIDTHVPPNAFSNCYKVNFRRCTDKTLHMSRKLWVSPVFSASFGCCRTVSCTVVTRLITQIGN